MYATPVDISNRALQLLGLPKIATLGDSSRGAVEMNLCYDKLRQAELQSHLWRFSTRKAAIRAVTTTTQTCVFSNWAVGTTYQQGDILNDNTANVGNNGTALYISLKASNTGNEPSASPTAWQPYFGPTTFDTYSSTRTYYTGEIAETSTSIYLNLVDGTLNATQASGAPWTAAVLSGVTGVTLFIPYPIAQFNNQPATARSVYPLPFGYLRPAPQDPKIAGGYNQSVSAGMQATDFQIEGGYLLTAATPLAVSGPLIFRFGADISDVKQMTPHFCEVLAIRMALDTCEALTTKSALKQNLGIMYDQRISLAHTDNLLELGSTDPKEEEFQMSRIPFNQEPVGEAPRGRGQPQG